jgi:molybdate/tungstate transport system ATP-binding protein
MIAIRGLCLERGVFRLRGVDLVIPAGAYAVLMGPTGCGKTTLLEWVAGLATAGAGTLMLEGRDATQLPAAERCLGYVPQDGALFKGLTVRENLGFALRIRKVKAVDVSERVDELSRLLDITHLLDRGISGLSGGERQRIALGRALAHRPGVMLLDEPLAALDEGARDSMCSLLETIHRETGATFLHVTHSAAEAERLATLRLDAAAIFSP